MDKIGNCILHDKIQIKKYRGSSKVRSILYLKPLNFKENIALRISWK